MAEPFDFRQTNIRYNHLAIVDEARAGPEARITLDGQDAVLINQEEDKMSGKKTRKVKIDAEEYMLEDDVGTAVEKMMNQHHEYKKSHEDFMGKHKMLKDENEKLRGEHEKMMAERDSLRDKDHHNPFKEHEAPANGEIPKAEEDEIGSEGKEEKDPTDSYGMSSHVKDYEKPTTLKEHVVSEPKNEHYPKDLPHVAKVDAAEVTRRVKQRVKLEKLSERYLDKQTVSRMDSISDLELKKRIILSIQKNAQLDGKSETYINARFDSVLENLPGQKVIAMPSRFDANKEKDDIDADVSRRNMIARQTDAYKVRSK